MQRSRYKISRIKVKPPGNTKRLLLIISPCRVGLFEELESWMRKGYKTSVIKLQRVSRQLPITTDATLLLFSSKHLVFKTTWELETIFKYFFFFFSVKEFCAECLYFAECSASLDYKTRKFYYSAGVFMSFSAVILYCNW